MKTLDELAKDLGTDGMKWAQEFSTRFNVPLDDCLGWFCNAIEAGKESGYTAAAPKWISVEDELPEKQGEYLVFTPVFKTRDGTLLGLDRIRVGCFATSDDFIANKQAGFYIDAQFYPEVTHWMPLPSAPEMKEEK